MSAENIIYNAERKIQSIISTKSLKPSHFHGEDNVYSRLNHPRIHRTSRKILTLAWKKPIAPWVKLNVDGCSKGSQGRAAAGGLLRDASGSVIFTFCINLVSCSAYLAELHAIRAGLSICIDNNINFIAIEMDSLTVVNQINNNHIGNWQTFEIFREIQGFLKSITWTCSHAFRESNSAADALANAGLNSAPLACIIAKEASGIVKGLTSLDAAGTKYFRTLK